MRKLLNFARRLIPVLLLTLLCNCAFGQRVITGTITNNDDGIGLPGVSIQIKGATIGTITDLNGVYSIEVPDNNATLRFSFVGFITEEIVVGDQTTISLGLLPDNAQLEEIVIVGYGSQKKENLTGAVSTVTAAMLENRPVANTAQALQGQVPGLNIVQGSGNPGNENLDIKIRGHNSYSSKNKPLILIDGMEGNIQDLDPSVIESVSVLKDASSAAIYGIKGANGVVLVNTKQGAKDKRQVTYSGSYAIHSPTKLPDMITNSVDFMELLNTAVSNTPGSSANQYPTDVIEAYRNSNGNERFPNTDWQSLIVKKGSVKRHNLGINGSSGKTSYNFNVGYWDQDGLIEKTFFEKANILLNVKTEVSDRVTMGASIMGLNSDRKGPEETWNETLFGTWRVRPTWGPYTLDGQRNFTAKAFSGSADDPDGLIHDEGFTRENPLIFIDAYDGYSATNSNFNGNAYLDIELINGLVWSTKGAFKFDYLGSKFQRLKVDEYNFRTGEYLRTTRDQDEIGTGTKITKLATLYSTFTYSKYFGNHSLKLLGGYSQEQRIFSEQNSTRIGVASIAIKDLNGSGSDNQQTSGYTTEYANRGWFGRVNYNFAERYLLEANLRIDKSSRFKKGNRTGVFPSFSAGWRINKENFMRNLSMFDQLKLRASWGQMGNNGDQDYPYQSLLSFGAFDQPGVNYGVGPYSYPYTNAITTGVSQEKLIDPRITWETTTIGDIGFDFSIFNGLLMGSVDYYSKVTTDILRELQVNSSTGLTGPEVNKGEMSNTGWDLVLGHNNFVSGFRYGITGNFGMYKNKLVKYGEREILGSNRNINEEDYSFNDYFMYRSDGFFNNQQEIDAAPTQPYDVQPGDIRLVDVAGPEDSNGNPTGPDGIVNENDRVHFDGYHPKFTYGFNLTAGYKGFDLSAVFYGIQGVNRYYEGMGVEPFVQDGNAQNIWRTDSWTPQNTGAKLPQVYYYTSASGQRADRHMNDFWLRNTSYFRMRNLTLGYSLPKTLLDNVFISKVRVYFSAENLFTIHEDIFNLDPEKPVEGGNSWAYPQYKSFIFGINVGF